MSVLNTIGNVIGKIAPAIPLAGAALDALSNASTNKANMKLAQYQWEKNVEMWNMQNQYNSPFAQMQRLKDAGLNPNMVYGNGSAANVSKDAPSYEAPRLQAYTGFSNTANNVVNSVLTSSQLKNMEIQNQLLQNDVRAKEVAIKDAELELQRKGIEVNALKEDYPYLRAYNRWHSANEESTNRRIESEISLNAWKYDLSEQDYKRAQVLYEKELEDLAIRRHERRDYEELGLRPSDPLWVRAIANVFIEMFGKGSAKNLLNKVLGL